MNDYSDEDVALLALWKLAHDNLAKGLLADLKKYTDAGGGNTPENDRIPKAVAVLFSVAHYLLEHSASAIFVPASRDALTRLEEMIREEREAGHAADARAIVASIFGEARKGQA